MIFIRILIVFDYSHVTSLRNSAYAALGVQLNNIEDVAIGPSKPENFFRLDTNIDSFKLFLQVTLSSPPPRAARDV